MNLLDICPRARNILKGNRGLMSDSEEGARFRYLSYQLGGMIGLTNILTGNRGLMSDSEEGARFRYLSYQLGAREWGINVRFRRGSPRDGYHVRGGQ